MGRSTWPSQYNFWKTLQRYYLWDILPREWYPYEWKEVQTLYPSETGKIPLCKCDDCVPITVLGRSRKTHLTSSAEDSAERTKELTPDERETTQASRIRSQDLPEWLQAFKEYYGGNKNHILWKWQQRSSRPTVSGASHIESTKGEAQVVYAFSPRPKIVRYAGVRKSQGHFADQIVVQGLATQRIQSYRCETRRQQRRESDESFSIPKKNRRL